MSKKEKKVLDELKNSIPKEDAQGDAFEVQTELTDADLDSASGGECRCLCGSTLSCGGGGGGGRAFEEPVDNL